MKSFFVILVVALVIGGCAYQQPRYIIIAEPGSVARPGQPTVALPSSQGQPPSVPAPPQVEVWRPDPTWILICNDSRTLFLEVWIDSGPPAPPRLKLIPELCGDDHVMLGDHFWYAQGYIETPAFGRVSTGIARRDFYIRNWSYLSGYALRIPINDGDFRR
jgi:hypothetical protein